MIRNVKMTSALTILEHTTIYLVVNHIQGAVAGSTSSSPSNAHQRLVQVLVLVLPTQRVLSYITGVSYKWYASVAGLPNLYSVIDG